MKKIAPLFLLSILLLGCQPVNTNENIGQITQEMTQNMTQQASNLYENATYGFRFNKPEGAEFSTQDYGIVTPNTAQYGISVYLGGSANVKIDLYLNGETGIYVWPEMLKNEQYKKITVNGLNAMQSEGFGTAEHWFVNTVVFGPKYIYEIQFSNDTKDQKYLDKLDEILQSFTFEQ